MGLHNVAQRHSNCSDKFFFGLLSQSTTLSTALLTYHQRRLANCDWIPASYASGQPPHPRNHPICWASSQWSRTASSTPYHETWTPAPLSAHLTSECRCPASQIETPSSTRRTKTCVRRTGRITNGMRSGWTNLQDSALSIPDTSTEERDVRSGRYMGRCL